MKEKYEAPNLQVVHVNVKHIVAVSQIGEGTGGFSRWRGEGDWVFGGAGDERVAWQGQPFSGAEDFAGKVGMKSPSD